LIVLQRLMVLYLEDLDFNINMSNLNSELYAHVSNADSPAVAENAIMLSQPREVVNLDAETLGGKIPLGLGFRDEPDPELLAANLGNVKNRSDHNDQWALRQANILRQKLGWDMSAPLGDVPFKYLDFLFTRLLTTSTKKNGKTYPSETLMNMLSCLSRILRQASHLREIEGHGDVLKAGFNVKDHWAFPKTKATVRAAVQKSAREGKNKKRNKVLTLTVAMETAILSDVDHQLTSSIGCQKRLAFYIMCRLGIHGGSELWKMQRNDLKLVEDSSGRECIM
jgi:hypothetical protein